MSEEKLSQAEAVAKSVEKISDSKGLAAIGSGLGGGIIALAGALMIVGMFFAINLGPAAKKWDGHLHPQTKCFELQEIVGKIFKVNTCTGETEELDPESEVTK